MPRASKVCSSVGCPKLVPAGTSRCTDCARTADRARGNFTQRGYGGPAWERARGACLQRDPVCVICRAAPANTADHYPEGRDALVARGVPDPDAPHRLRGLCRPCHSRETAKRQPGGWNRRES
jgi:5-methylcytosine-specific restriction protein A